MEGRGEGGWPCKLLSALLPMLLWHLPWWGRVRTSQQSQVTCWALQWDSSMWTSPHLVLSRALWHQASGTILMSLWALLAPIEWTRSESIFYSAAGQLYIRPGSELLNPDKLSGSELGVLSWLWSLQCFVSLLGFGLLILTNVSGSQGYMWDFFRIHVSR